MTHDSGESVKLVLEWVPIRCDCGTIIAEQLGRFLRYRCRDRRCVTGEDKHRMVYLDLSKTPPSIVARQVVEAEVGNG